MSGFAAHITLILFPFLAGNICSILYRQPKLSVIGRPLARTMLVFCLGTWLLNRPADSAQVAFPDAFGLIPWLLLTHLLISFIQNDDRTGSRGLRFDALLYSASFLSAICLTQNLVFLMLFGESLAVSTWLTSTGATRRRMVQRSLATFALIAIGTGLILSHTGTAEFARFENPAASATDQSDFGRFKVLEPDTSLAMRTGLLFLVVGLSWRIGFFPFQPSNESAQTLGGFQRQVSLITAATLLLTILLPGLSGYENFGLMLLFTLAVPTLVRETWKSRTWESAGELWSDWWRASTALMWISLGLALLSIRQQPPFGFWLPAGREAIRLELLSSLGAYVVLTAVSRAFGALGRPLSTRESLTGLMWTTPFYGFVMMLGILSWVGVPGLAGFAPRWGVISGLLEVAGTGRDGSGYFFLIGILVLCCQAVMVSLGLQVVQSLCDPSPATRPTGQVRVWRVWPFAVLLFAIVAAEWF